MIEMITYCFNLSGYYEVGHTEQQYMHRLRQKLTRPFCNSGWMLLLRISVPEIGALYWTA